ncbi:hypothetical protein QTH91_19610 [Variovorax dokdonensis]|uniref:DUF1127 domain-containing protein n=1 Tax=Variovorax dokdonensis TaxID=344883 RepID=A0ABT7NFJ9_9BURK|nr:hypothetical protein [Variovorax dokdonensis]MDM0046707.1 hypothetical protein [Variovorax dokdonensis]
MNTVALHLPSTLTLRLLPLLTALRRHVDAWRAHAHERRRMAAELRMLAALDQHDLNDLGVGRSELGYWATRPR